MNTHNYKKRAPSLALMVNYLFTNNTSIVFPGHEDRSIQISRGFQVVIDDCWKR